MDHIEQTRPPVIRIRRRVVAEMLRHAQSQAPLEACGYLAEREGVVQECLPLANVDASAGHFTLDPREQFAAIRKIRGARLRLRAVYHSHPSSPACPSAEDIRLAWDPDLSYLIVSLTSGTSALASFRIKRQEAVSETVEVVD
jgi:proteasome lid subunit RPN8/RPN11